MQPGFAVSSLDELGEGFGFRKIRAALGVTAFGCNAIVLPPGFASHKHFHDEQEELYFVHSGTVVFSLDGEEVELGPGGLARVAPETVRGFRNPSDTEPAVYLCIGGKDGYVGRDAHTVE
jgi:uncharacterized cupin superfamily protein